MKHFAAVVAVVASGFCTPTLAAGHVEIDFEHIVMPSLIVGGTLLAMKAGQTKNTCMKDPCNSLSHVAIGGVVGALIKQRYGWEKALAAGFAVGVGKELMDKNFDVKDALMTTMGAVISISIDF